MEITKAQEIVDQWINTLGVRYFNELTNTAILMEEVGEVARLMARMYGEQSFKSTEIEKNSKEKIRSKFIKLLLSRRKVVHRKNTKNLSSIFIFKISIIIHYAKI